MPIAYDPRQKRAFANTMNYGWKYKTNKQENNPRGDWLAIGATSRQSNR
jgi:hypothetical protein